MGCSSLGSGNDEQPDIDDESNEENEDRVDSQEDGANNQGRFGWAGHNQEAPGEEVFDEDDDSDDDDGDSYGQQYGLIIAAGGANELIQPMMNMDENLLGAPSNQNYAVQEGGGYVLMPAPQNPHNWNINNGNQNQ